MKLIKSKKAITALAIIFIVSTAIKSINLLIIALSVSILFKIYSPIISNKIFDSKIFKLVIVFFGYAVLLQCTILISWLINRNFPLDLVPLLTFTITLLIFWFENKRRPIRALNLISGYPSKTVNTQDIISIAVAIFIPAIILIAPLTRDQGNTKSILIISVVNGNVDDSAHIAFVNDRIQFNRGILSGSDAASKARSQSFYPAGWHSMSAIFIKTIYPNIKTGFDSLMAYAIQKLLWFSILIYLLLRTAFTIYRFTSNKMNKNISYVWLATASSLFGCIFLIPIFREGFYSFIPQLISAIITLLLLAQICDDKNNNKPIRSLPLLYMVCVGGCLSWLLPLPAFFLTALIATIYVAVTESFIDSLKNFYKIFKMNLIIIVTLFVAVFVQLYVMLTIDNKESVSFMSGIMLDGGITQYSDKYMIFVCTGFLICLVLANRKIKKNIHLLLLSMVSLSLFCMLIYFLQMKSLGRTAYYFYKTLDILIITALPFCIAGFGLLIEKICEKSPKSMKLFLSILVFAGSLMLIGIETWTLSYSGGQRDVSGQIDNSLYQVMNNEISEDNYFEKNYVFYYVPGTNYYFQSEISNMLAKSNETDSTCFQSIRKTIWGQPMIGALLEKIRLECSGYHISIFTNTENFDSFLNEAGKAKMSNSVTIKKY